MAFVGNSPPSFLRLQGCIDENTLVWGQGLFDWLPAKNIKLLLPMIRTPEGECGSPGAIGDLITIRIAHHYRDPRARG